MAENTHISWTDHTFNPWRGCTKVSDGCKHCYAETLSKRNPKVLGVWGPTGTRAPASEDYWREPLQWNEEAKAAGERRRVFCASLADVFEGPETCHEPDAYKVIEDGRRRLFVLIERTPHLDWLLLTKRPENIDRFLPVCWGNYLGGVVGFVPSPKNIWLGTSVEDQDAADKRVPELIKAARKKLPNAIRFLSCEPLLGPVKLWDFDDWDGSLHGVGIISSGGVTASTPDSPPEGYDDSYAGIDWVIAGGESGPNARPMHPEWARSLRDQCEMADIAFHFKQHGEWAGWGAISDNREGGRDACKTPSLWVHPDGHTSDGSDNLNGSGAICVYRVGKKAAGRLLDSREWNELPEATNVNS